MLSGPHFRGFAKERTCYVGCLFRTQHRRHMSHLWKQMAFCKPSRQKRHKILGSTKSLGTRPFAVTHQHRHCIVAQGVTQIHAEDRLPCFGGSTGIGFKEVGNADHLNLGRGEYFLFWSHQASEHGTDKIRMGANRLFELVLTPAESIKPKPPEE